MDAPGPPSPSPGERPLGYFLPNHVEGKRRGDARGRAVPHGDVIRFMWDYGVQVPLWSGRGPLPEDPQRLQALLGIGEELVDALREWGEDMCRLDSDAPRPATQAYADLDRRARTLVTRLRDEVGTRFRVVYEPWVAVD